MTPEQYRAIRPQQAAIWRGLTDGQTVRIKVYDYSSLPGDADGKIARQLEILGRVFHVTPRGAFFRVLKCRAQVGPDMTEPPDPLWIKGPPYHGKMVSVLEPTARDHEKGA
jgi:hypothetical protein